MKKKEIEDIFGGILEKEHDVSAGMAAIQTLLTVLERDTSETVQELDSNLQAAVDAMKKTDYPVTAVASGSELFLRFITLAKLDTKRVLTHSKSRVVLKAMKEAARANKRFEVYITVSSPDNSGQDMCCLLEKENIPCTLILDSAVGYVMEQVDMVMVGAEGVVESGGIINKVGSYTMAMCARELKKPFYVLTESFKFVRLYPLNQHDLPDEFKYTSSKLKEDLSKEHPMVDYTPPSYITLLFTDLGILTPSAVSDELIKLYL
ncbi:translation initiation factor eIF2B subunit alpha isoform X2 [Periplaneta americana]|uniref:translation initiation factor eIF2B subunit alpha isoform X2 n=1 Tax=Periplaneta americana TaxID=6978 RepID=UPI0037E844B1